MLLPPREQVSDHIQNLLAAAGWTVAGRDGTQKSGRAAQRRHARSKGRRA